MDNIQEGIIIADAFGRVLGQNTVMDEFIANNKEAKPLSAGGLYRGRFSGCEDDQKHDDGRKWLELQTVFEGMTDAIYVFDKDGGFMFSNKAAKEFYPDIIFSRAGDSYAYAKYYNMDGEEIEYENSFLSRMLKGEQVTPGQIKVVYKDVTRYVSVSCIPVTGREGLLEYVVLCGREITEAIDRELLIKKQQDELLQFRQERNKALQNNMDNLKIIDNLMKLNSLKDKLLTVVSHDIRLPMASMTSLIEILEDDVRHYNDDNIEIIKAVKEQVNDTCKTVENILEWLKSQMQGLVYNPLIWNLFNIAEEVVRLVRNSAEAKSIRINTDIDRSKNVYADRGIMELVLRNLLSNAIKYTGSGGRISIYSYESGHETIVAVKDSGTGLDSEKVKLLFSEAYVSSTTGTAGEKGAGLGLLICKEYVSRYGGRIWAESIPGQGSTFYFSILSADKRGSLNSSD